MKLADLFNNQALILTEAKARIEHPEDMIFDGGLAGARAALKILEATAHQPEHVSIKMDGCVHPDSVLLTESGEMKIIDLINSPDQHRVLTHNFEINADQYCLAEHPRINNNQKNWVQINLEDGSHITLTDDHEVYTLNRGWIQAKDIESKDDIKEYQR